MASLGGQGALHSRGQVGGAEVAADDHAVAIEQKISGFTEDAQLASQGSLAVDLPPRQLGARRIIPRGNREPKATPSTSKPTG